MYGRRAGGAPALWRRVRWANVGRLAALLAAGALILVSAKPSGPGEPALVPAPAEHVPRERPPPPSHEPDRPGRTESQPKRPPRPKRRRKPAEQRTEPPEPASPVEPQAPKPPEPAPPAPPLSPPPAKPTPGEFTPDPA